MVVALPRSPAHRILTPDDAARATESRIGGKAMGLARLERLGANVPEWCVVPVESFTSSLVVSGMMREIERKLVAIQQVVETYKDSATDKVEALAAPIRAWIEKADIAPTLQRELSLALNELGDGPFSVRSSMVGEDSSEQSWAGQLESYLDQPDEEHVICAIRRCWASAFSARALMYRARTRSGLTLPQIGVIVQRMVHGQVSGVVFTAHPISGRRDHALITSAWGLGEGIVSGECNTDEFVWSHVEGELSRRIADKDRRVVSDGVGTIVRAIEGNTRRCSSLSTRHLATLAEESIRIAYALGAPQDIEWTIRDGELFLLQTRPITALPVPQNTDGPKVVFDNSNIQESYCGVTTPLTFSFASFAYATVYEQTMRAFRLPESTIEAHKPLLRNLLGLIKGRVYYNINNWYRGLLVLPSFGRNKEDMEKMMGLEEPVDFVEDNAFSWRQLPRLIATLTHLLFAFRRLETDVAGFLAHFESAYRKVDRAHLHVASYSNLIGTLSQLKHDFLNRWETPIINDFYVMMAMGRLRRLVDDDALVNDLIAGEEGIESVEPTRALMRIAKTMRDYREDEPNPKALAAYIDRYGDRVIGELKLETITLREDPTFALKVIENYTARPDLDPDTIAERERGLRKEAERTARKKVGLFRRRALTKALKNARASVKNRENMRLARTRMFGLYRDVFRGLGNRLFEAGCLENPRDVFYLTVEELIAYHEGRAVSADFASIARARKTEYAAYEHEELPHRFETIGPVYHGNVFENPPVSNADISADTLTGTGCYPGVVEAPVRVIMNPNEELSLNQKILVTVRTDPGWAPLFPTTEGILVERGSTLSHSAVVARELGIPAVVGIPNLTKILKDGERVRMDGARGTVDRLDV